ncbi:TetR family transcriptional regulator [Pseudonocardia nigra]|uniref:TetR family transcriptional regulator n=1 Tax=Pseudonocardia nigra TaxID=1921578 RepID=UPI001C5D54D4|nr:TetR family transcriptional regulator [Pseudonocardia nigra]
MDGRQAPEEFRRDTRQRVLDAARELFARPGGYRATSMRQIGERLGVTKAALYYHFRSKDEILQCLTAPLLDALDAALDAAAAERGLARVRRHVVDGSVAAMLAHRDVLTMLLRDLALLSETAVGARLAAVMVRGQDLLAGPDAGLGQRIRAFQLTSGLANTITRFADVPAEVLRVHLLDGARVVLAGLPAADEAPPAPRGRPRGRAGGRPRALGQGAVDRARERYRSGEPVERIAQELGVSRATVYRHLNAPEL